MIHGLQMGRSGQEFGNEFGYHERRLDLSGGVAKPGRLEGDYLKVDLVQVAAGLGARAVRATSAAEVRAAVDETREHAGLVVIVVPVIPHADLPGAGRPGPNARSARRPPHRGRSLRWKGGRDVEIGVAAHP